MEKKLLKKNLSSLILACLILVMYDYGAYRFLAYSTRAYWSALIIPVPKEKEKKKKRKKESKRKSEK